MKQSVKNSCNSLDVFKPVLKIGFFSLILITSLKRRTFQFLWQSIILFFICTKFIPDVLGSCTSLPILSENSVGANLAILNICWTPLHLLWWVLTTLSLSLKHIQHFFQIKFSQFSQLLQMKSIFVTPYKTLKVTDCSFLQFDLILRMPDLNNEQPLTP